MSIIQRRPIEDHQVSWAISMATLSRDLHVLPGPGGLLDQDSYHMWLLESALAVLNEKEQMDIKAEQNKAKSQSRR